jgi:hypothetical protein
VSEDPTCRKESENRFLRGIFVTKREDGPKEGKKLHNEE